MEKAVGELVIKQLIALVAICLSCAGTAFAQDNSDGLGCRASESRITVNIEDVRILVQSIGGYPENANTPSKFDRD